MRKKMKMLRKIPKKNLSKKFKQKENQNFVKFLRTL